MGTGVLMFHRGGGGLGGESHSSCESELVSEDECEGEGVVSEVEAFEDGSLWGGKTEGNFEGELLIGE